MLSDWPVLVPHRPLAATIGYRVLDKRPCLVYTGGVPASENDRKMLESLEEEERMVSIRRQRLHDRIDFLRASDEPDAAERLAKFYDDERELAARRRELHASIDALRVELGAGTPGPPSKESLRDR